MKYIRLAVGNPEDDLDTLTGVFTESRFLLDKNLLADYEAEFLEETYHWFNENLTCPPWSDNDWKYGVSWFKQAANQFINKMWDLAKILKEHGKPVRMFKSNNPGKIVYQDEFQVVAIAWIDV